MPHLAVVVPSSPDRHRLPLSQNLLIEPHLLFSSGGHLHLPLHDCAHSLFRLEYSPTKVFEDRPTYLALNRKFEFIPPFKVSSSPSRPGWTQISTSALVLSYLPSTDHPFDASNLVISLRQPVSGQNVTWIPGMVDTGNLLGTIHTLDMIEGVSLLSPPIPPFTPPAPTKDLIIILIFC